jgi:hypothetical protein
LYSTTDKLDLKLSARRNPRLILVPSLVQEGKQLDWTHCLAQRIKDGWEVKALFPKPGDYILRFFVKIPLAGKKFQGDWIMDIRITASQGRTDDKAHYAVIDDRFLEEGCYLVGPLSGVLTAGRPVKFKAVMPKAVAAAVLMRGNKLIRLKKKAGAFVGNVRLLAGDVLLCAEFPNRKGFFWGLVKYAAK